ncbi:MAG: ASC-1-like (ASCH) protein [Myxococcota bacterium]|jgi:ASC-1-like (ASCH) protein
MATFDAPFHPEAFDHMEHQRKTVYALIASPEFSYMSSGDRLEFGSYGSITVGTVRRYPNLEKLVEIEGFQTLVPDAESAEEACSSVREVSDWNSDAEQEHGVLALRVREARRKD